MSNLTNSTPCLQTRAELIGNLIFIDLLAMPGAPVLLLCHPKCHCACVSLRSTKEVTRENDRPRGIPGQEQHGDVHPVENPESNDTEDVLNCEITPAQADLDLANKPSPSWAEDVLNCDRTGGQSDLDLAKNPESIDTEDVLSNSVFK
jgi:hypothetical protein